MVLRAALACALLAGCRSPAGDPADAGTGEIRVLVCWQDRGCGEPPSCPDGSTFCFGGCGGGCGYEPPRQPGATWWYADGGR